MLATQVRHEQTDVLVIGGGLAGIFAAVTARDHGAQVTLVDKGTVGASGQTAWGTGMNYYDEGVSASRETWHQLMAEKSDHLYNPHFLDMFMDDSKEVFSTMNSWNVMGSIRPVPRFANVLKNTGVNVHNRTMITKLIKEDGRIVGAAGFPLDEEGVMVLILCKCVINCAGAGCYKSPGFPVQGLTFDGDAISYRVGAEISGKEFNDLHTTDSTHPGSCWYGNGSIWGPGYHKAAFGIEAPWEMPFTMESVFQAEQGAIPLTVSRPEGKGKAGGPPPPPYITEVIPKNSPPRSVDLAMAGNRQQPPSYPLGGTAAGMSVHKGEGIFPKDGKGTCQSNVAGLYAAGDSLCSMLTGSSYRIPGMALIASGVQGIAAAKECIPYVMQTPHDNGERWDVDALTEELFRPLTRTQGYDPRWAIQLLQSIMMPYYILYYKSKERLESALVQLEYLRDHIVPNLRADDAHTLKLAHETANMVLNAEMKLRASLFRTESRGSHFREDFPQEDSDQWLAWVVISNSETGTMALRKHPIPPREEGMPYGS